MAELRPRIPVAGPWITDLEIQYVSDAAATNWYGQARDYIGRFEAGFAAYAHRAHAVALPSCTAGIHLALAALGIGAGDEVILPEATWIASAAPVHYVGATPVFVDIDPTTWCIDVASLRAAITDRTRAIIVVDLYGAMPEVAAIVDLAREHGIAVIEDAAEAVGATVGERPAGSFGDVSVFSFHGSKTLTTGEGGMVLTDDPALHQSILTLRDHGRVPGSTDFRSSTIGFKYQMSSMQAALGLAQLERVAELVAKKRQIFGWYEERLGPVAAAQLNAEPPGTTNAYWMVTVVVDGRAGLEKVALRSALLEDGVDSRPFFDPLTSIDPFRSARGGPERNPVSYDIARRAVNLPSALSLEEDDVERVVQSLSRILDGRPR